MNQKTMNEETIKNTVLIPILKKMGFDKRGDIEYEKTLSEGKRLDLLLRKNKKNICVVECKKQGTNLKSADIIKQAYLYATDFEIRAPYFALCNGEQFFLYKTLNTRYAIYENQELQKIAKDIAKNKKELNIIANLLLEDKDFVFDRQGEEWYDKCLVPSIIKKPKNQATARNFGVHTYFTRQSWDIVASHIRAFSQQGDTVLDPFGGTGVTLNESLMNRRHGIFVDLNPFTVFWRETILDDTCIEDIEKESIKVIKKYKEFIDTIKYKDIKKFLPKNKNIKNKNIPKLYDLFSEKQLLELGLLKKIILSIKNNGVRNNLLLAFSSSLSNHNLTYFVSDQRSNNKNAGASALFVHYSYDLGQREFNVDLMNTFQNKINRLIKSKVETEWIHTYKPELRYEVYRGDASDLRNIKDDSIDYIYTDPPYGHKIQYLDLSIMFNEWLDLEVTSEDFQNETIAKSKDEGDKKKYLAKIEESIEEMYRVLKTNRYLSFVFQDTSIYYFENITAIFDEVGFELIAINSQKTGRTTFKKKKFKNSILSSQLILIYKKTENIGRNNNYDKDWQEQLRNHIESEITKRQGATYDELHDSIIRHGIILGIYDPDKFDKVFAEMLKDYEPDGENKYQISKTKGFKSNLPIHERADYFISAFLTIKNKQQLYPTTDEILMEVMPSLKNGVNPTDEDITDVLDRIAIEHDGGWMFLGEASVKGKLF